MSEKPAEQPVGFLHCPECGSRDLVFVAEYPAGPYSVFEEWHCRRCGRVLQLERHNSSRGW